MLYYHHTPKGWKMVNDLIDGSWLVSNIFERFPQTLSVFLEWKLDCFGCSLADFCTLKDVAKDYGVDLDQFIQALEKSITD
jgi:hybrid cluster-associated redox disulfide protein